MNQLIYLAGPILGRSDTDCKLWRQHAEKLWAGPTLNPMMRDYRGREQEPGVEVEIVEGDKADIDRARGLLVYFDRPSVGTAMEVLYAWQMGKPVVVLNASGSPVSPWLRYHSSAIIDSQDPAGVRRDIAYALAKLSTLIG